MDSSAITQDRWTPYRRPPERGGAEDARIATVMARFIGVGFAAYFLITIPALGQPPGLVAPWFTPIAVVLAFGPGFTLLVVASVSTGQRYLQPLVYSCAAGYLLAGLLWFAAWSGEPVADVRVSWLSTFAGLPAMAVALYRLRAALVTLVLCSALNAAITAAGRTDDVVDTTVISEAAWTVLFTVSFVVVTALVVRMGGILDRTRAAAVAAATASASAAARNSERSRIDALIHDRVIATLVAAKGHPDDPRLPRQARDVLGELDELAAAEGVIDGQLSVNEAVARMRTLAATIDADVPIGVHAPEQLDRTVARYPEPVIRAMTEAMGEALRNSVLHAGPDAERVILIEPAEEQIAVSVADNGVGFDPAQVPPERLGIRVSIRSRLAEVPGASAQIQSTVGRGTVVRLDWSRP
ncbi:putative two-component histidine kinase [Gordonia hirsuta DSM 44140 = NBRC 16056]|uniref:Putative two-component histidine kinase n=1 Tax=Gordonia hirsuta DSM 44140 = NBRC 16056 TaxID=1121927 RepID=L7L8T5_9ACTN|nr:ATP-binding protein [Gordonia hirsuta]GAC56438.1 putative two-component histidine kinase [Gordonia hirsuta DSM 44140 = NBRC 16056]